jgi:hypothetical protein
MKCLIVRELDFMLTYFCDDFRELREIIKPEITELIRKHRLTYLEGGSRFPKFDNRGNRIKSMHHSY